MYLLNITYNKSLDDAKNLMEEHKSFRDKQYKDRIFICSGKKTSKEGAVILCNGEEKKVKSIIEEDPLYINGFVNYELMEFEINKCLEEFENCIKK